MIQIPGGMEYDSTDIVVEVLSFSLRHSVLTGCNAFCDVIGNRFFNGRQGNTDGIA